MSLATQNTLEVKTIDHATLVVADLQRSRDFYVELLGMDELPRPDFGFPGLWFQAGMTQIHLNVAGPEAGSAGIRYDAPKITRALHIAFAVEDAEVASEILRQRGVEITVGPRHRPDGAVQLYVMDPDGHQIEITSPAKT